MDDILKTKSYLFALSVVRLSRRLQSEYSEYVLSRQILKSGTAIGGLIREARYAQSRKDFINKLSIALKEASETEYWIELLMDSGLIGKDVYSKLLPEIIELIKLLTSSINTAKARTNA